MKKYLSLLSFALLLCGGLKARDCQSSSGLLSCSNSSSCSDCNSNNCSCECKVTSKSFLSMRGYFDDPTAPPKVSLIRSAVQEMQSNNGNLFQVVPFGGSTIHPKLLAWYFGPSCKRVLTVATNPGTDVDILAENLGIYVQSGQNFQSTFCLSPKQTFAGVGFNYRTHFWCNDRNRGFFLDITLPVSSVENSVNLEELVTDAGGGPLVTGGPANVTEAFKQSSWCFGRINDCNKMKKTGVSMLDLQLGYGWGRDQAHMHSYIGVMIPTGNKVHSNYLFEPIVGWNHHTAVHFGSNFGVELWHDECRDWTIWYELAIDSRYFFENKQYRSFDLKGKPWSRYMQVYTNKAQAQEAFVACGSPVDCSTGQTTAGLTSGTPGINIFTQQVKVRPRFQRSYNTAFVFDLKDLIIEGGYNFFSNDQECVKLACSWDRLVGIQTERQDDGTYIAIDGPALKAAANGCGCTNSAQTINASLPGETDPFSAYQDNIITADQLDLSSAESPCSLRHWLYGSVGYTLDCGSVRTLLGVGGSYEFAGDNGSVDRWGVWGKIGVIF